MQTHSLEIDDFEDCNYTLISIHTSLEAYKLAYLLNENLKVFFKKSKTSLDLKGVQEASFSVYNYEDETQLNKWYLVSNKCQSISKTFIEHGLFESTNQRVNRANYLVTGNKKTDYLLKIEGDYDSVKLNETIQSIKNIKQVITSYTIDITTLKSKDLLIF